MKYLVQFVQFWYDFIVGDDWVIAAGMVIFLVITGLLVRSGFDAWWMMPVAVCLLLAASLWRVAAKS